MITRGGPGGGGGGTTAGCGGAGGVGAGLWKGAMERPSPFAGVVVEAARVYWLEMGELVSELVACVGLATSACMYWPGHVVLLVA
jgi:hypothetical protein